MIDNSYTFSNMSMGEADAARSLLMVTIPKDDAAGQEWIDAGYTLFGDGYSQGRWWSTFYKRRD